MEIPILKSGQTGRGFLIEYEGYTLPATKNSQNPLIENILTEDINSKTILIDCILQKGDVRNRNGRIYPTEILKKQVDVYVEYINEGSSVGEADHPDTGIISLHNFAHRIVKVWWEGNVCYGTIELIVSDDFLKTGRVNIVGDKIALYLFKYKIKLGISSRGIGSVEERQGSHIVQDDFELICWDIVHSPSTPGAYLFNLRKSDHMKESYTPKKEIYTNKLITSLEEFLK